MKLRVRRAQHRDEQRILDLLLQVNNVHADGRPDIFIADQRKYTDGQLSLLIDDETRPIFVAVDDDEYVYGYGFCIVTEVKDGSNLQPIKTLYIDDLCVDQTIRRMGTGQIIYDFIKDYAKEINRRAFEDKVFATIRDKVSLTEKTVSVDEFNKLFDEKK